MYTTRKNNKLFVFVGLILIIMMVSAGVYANIPKQTEVKKVIAIEYKQIANSPTPKSKKEKMNVTIQVLNGSGIVGQADSIVRALEDAGYDRANIKFGNADVTNRSSGIITARADFEETVTDIKNTLKQIYPEIMDSELNTNPKVDSNPNIDSGFDIVIVTGEKEVS